MKVHPLVLTIVTLWLVEDSRATWLRGTTGSPFPTSGVGYAVPPPSGALGGLGTQVMQQNIKSIQNIANPLQQGKAPVGISKALLEKLSNAGQEEVAPELTEEDPYRMVKEIGVNDPFNV